jgi:hypothetical protein
LLGGDHQMKSIVARYGDDEDREKLLSHGPEKLGSTLLTIAKHCNPDHLHKVINILHQHKYSFDDKTVRDPIFVHVLKRGDGGHVSRVLSQFSSYHITDEAIAHLLHRDIVDNDFRKKHLNSYTSILQNAAIKTVDDQTRDQFADKALKDYHNTEERWNTKEDWHRRNRTLSMLAEHGNDQLKTKILNSIVDLSRKNSTGKRSHWAEIEIAKSGNDSHRDILIKHKDPHIRATVAEHGNDLHRDQLVKDRDDGVRYAVAKYGNIKHKMALWNDKEAYVSSAARR